MSENNRETEGFRLQSGASPATTATPANQQMQAAPQTPFTPSTSPQAWNIERSAELYQINGWGSPYFRINERGHVDVRPHAGNEYAIDLHALTLELEERGLELPLLIRFPDILSDRIRRINECFIRAVKEYDYGGRYQGVFPVKVNQQAHVVEEIVKAGREFDFGLEAGSKPELLIALSAMQEAGGLIICNGYKDLNYIETALLAQQFDKTVIVVLERIEELDIALKASEKCGVRPILGVRAKLSTKGMGRWADSAGDRAKFGLTSAEIVEVVDRLAERDMLDCLRLLHFHIGSQISSIIPIKNALREACRFYVELAKMGAKMGYLDVGGGLAVDYDGSKTDFQASKNYDIQEYAYDVVAAIRDSCEQAKLPAPIIVSESGRAIASHQSVLVFEILGANEVRFGPPNPPANGSHTVLQGLFETYKGIMPKNVQEALHDSLQAKEEAQSLFKFGYLSLRDRANAERLFWSCCEKILEQSRRLNFIPEEIQHLQKLVSAIYYCNFSIFQSAPDTWAIDQLFPVMPIQRLGEEPTVRARLADLTCDSEGIIDHFIDVEEVKHSLEVHPLKNGDRYLVGMFLVGAYQEILGDLHNLFGDTNAVHVRVTEHGYDIDHVIRGDSVEAVLRWVEYEPRNMIDSVRRQAERALSQGRINLPQMKMLMRHYEEGLRSYTYLTTE